jgi:hypothetical protein
VRRERVSHRNWQAHTLVTATGAFDLSFVHCSCAARAVPSDSVSCMLICWLLDVSRLIASRMVFRAQRLGHDKREQRRRVARESCNASAAKPINLGNGK